MILDKIKVKFLILGLKGKLPKWMYRLTGQKIAEKIGLTEGNMEEEIKKPWYKSKAKIAAVVTVVVGAVQPISQAFGHPVVVPDFVIQLLIGLGIYGIRDSIKS